MIRRPGADVSGHTKRKSLTREKMSYLFPLMRAGGTSDILQKSSRGLWLYVAHEQQPRRSGQTTHPTRRPSKRACLLRRSTMNGAAMLIPTGAKSCANIEKAGSEQNRILSSRPQRVTVLSTCSRSPFFFARKDGICRQIANMFSSARPFLAGSG